MISSKRQSLYIVSARFSVVSELEPGKKIINISISKSNNTFISSWGVSLIQLKNVNASTCPRVRTDECEVSLFSVLSALLVNMGFFVL